MPNGLSTSQDTTAIQDAQETAKLAVGKGYLSQSEPSDSASRDASPVPSKARVVIIGAGLAGLAAAQRLHERGLSDVVILDAQDRVGGRVHTIKHSDYLLELGAQWLHGAEDNPLHEWLTGLKMLDDFEDASMGFRGSFCTSAGGGGDSQQQVISSHLVEKVLKILNESKSNLFNELEESSSGVGGGSKKNAAQVFRHHLEECIQADHELASESAQLIHALFEWFLRYETIENCCDHMDEVSIQSYTDWSDLGDGTLLNFKDGYQSLLAWFCEHFPRQHWLHLNKQVLNVEVLQTSRCGEVTLSQVTSQSDDTIRNGAQNNTCVSRDNTKLVDVWGRAHSSPVLVKYKDLSTTTATEGIMNQTNDNDGDNYQIIECDHVIVTVSLGCLKSNLRTFFTPQLCPARRDLIESLGFGTVNKIVLQFERAFWSPDGGGLKLVWRNEDFAPHESSAACFPAWSRDILAFDVVRRQPNLLIGWSGGRGAKQMELESNETVGEICLRILERFLPQSHAAPTRLVACLCSRWYSNPFTRGSYSFQSMRSFGLDVAKLHEPIYDIDLGTNLDSATTSPGDHLKEKFVSFDGNNNSSSHQHDESHKAARTPRVMFAGEATAGKHYSTAHGAIISGWREADRLTDSLIKDNKSLHHSQSVESRCSLTVHRI